MADEGRLQLPLTGGGSQLTAVVRTLGEADIPLASLDTHIPSLDEVFLKLTGPAAREPVAARSAT